MPEYNLVQLDALYLTDDGLVGGTKCRTEITGLDALRNSHSVGIVNALDKTPYSQSRATAGVGDPLSIRVFYNTDTNLTAIVALINAAVLAGNTVTVIISGDTGNFNFEALPGIPGAAKPVEFSGEFTNSIVKDIVLNFTVSSIN